MEFAREYGALFGLLDPADELVLEKVTEEKDGASFVRYQQVYQGIPVLGGELVVQLDGMKRLLSLSGKVLPKISLSTSPAISAAEAQQEAFCPGCQGIQIFVGPTAKPNHLPCGFTSRP